MVKPLRIKFKENNAEKTIYLFANFHHKHGIRATDNEEVYEELIGRIATSRTE